MEQEIVNSLWFLAPATKKARYLNEIAGFPFDRGTQLWVSVTYELDLKKISGVELARCQLYGHCFRHHAI